MSALCGENGAFDFASGCVRGAWSAILPTLIVFLISLGALPLPNKASRILGKIKAPFRVFLSVHEAEALSIAGDAHSLSIAPAAPLWRTVVLTFVSLSEALCWTAIASTTFILKDEGAWVGLQALLMAGTWIYAAGRPVIRPPTTVPWDLFVLFCAHLFGAVIILGGVMFDHAINGVPWPSTLTLVAQSLHLAAVLLVFGVVLQTQLNVPSDSIDKEEIRDIPEDYVTLFEWLTFSWVYAFIRKGRYNTLDLTDVWNLSPIMRSRPVFIKFSSLKVPSLLQRLFWANSFDIIMDGVGHFFGVALGYARVYLLKAILDAVDHADASDNQQRSRAYLYALLSFLAVMLRCCIDMQHLWLSRRASTRMKSELMAAIYDKALKRKDFSGLVDADAVKDAKGKADAGADTGKIVNLMSADASRISNLVNQLYFFYTAPFEITVASIFLYQLLGWSAFAGFLVIPVLSPLNSMIGRRSVRIQKGVSVARDKRMGVLNEVVTAIKFIKFFAWESRWIERTLDARENEMKWMIKARLNTVLFYTVWSLTPILISATSFCVFVATGHQLTIATAFTAIALFTMLRWPLNNIPNVIMQILQCNVALKRIAVFLDEDEVTEQVSSLKKDLSAPQSQTTDNVGALGIENGTFRWNTVESEETDVKPAADQPSPDTASTADTIVSCVDSTNGANNYFELRDISVRFPEGKLTIVTGPTASGKTALLLAVLGEMTLVNGRLLLEKNPQRIDEHGMAHSISYAAQTPWLRHQSIKNNILFGYPYDEARYREVVECCALKPDFDMLEDGDETEIGARGVNLSGGQKARVALARAVYARAKYVLLDDPLSAVDSHTSRFLFERLLCGPLLRNRTVVLVTHHVDLVLPGAHYLIRMLDGRIDTQGSVQDLRVKGVLEDIAQSEEAEAHKVEGTSLQEKAGPSDDVVDIEETAVAKKPRQLIKDEHREVGGVKWHIYKTYLGASSYWIWGILFFIVIAKEVLGVGEKIWIIIWGRAYGHQANDHHYSAFISSGSDENQVSFSSSAYPIHHSLNASGDVTTSEIHWPDANEHPLFYVFTYAAIGIMTAIVNVSAISAQLWGGLRASRLLFRRLLFAVVHATFRFHDTTPQGRLLNRFGKDIETVDSSLASSLQSVNSSLATCFVAVLTIAVVFPAFLLPAIVIGLIFRECAIGYLETGRDLRRLEANTRSPIFSDFAEVLEGIVTVRAFSAEKRFMNNMHNMIDATSKCYYVYWLTNRWLQWCISTLGGLAVLITMIFSISSLNAGIAGLCITSALGFTDALYWACRNWTSLELDLNSVERVVEYLDLPQEPPAIIEDHRPPAYWPSNNSESLVSVEDLSIRYSPELPAVIQNISFNLRGGERVGLLGRTGSGKSTLAMSLLRFVDPSSGRIVIDGIDITTIGVQDLRSRITFIPQDATLFSGTLRDNLDPFGEHEDSEIFDVLERVGMIGTTIASRADTPTGGSQATPAPSSPTSSITNVEAKTTIGPSTQVSPGGTNFSQGQRQLVAMARALLRQSSVIILDEATSSIDFATDRKIQQTIREEFGRSLLITVAHRLRTVIDYDRLIVLDKGQIAEFDTPANLIEREGGIFRTMCLKSGHFAELEAAAKAKHI
uniref:Multidrug resistance-associated ABC transporter n=1 Tax=Schizophyllum commune (strain H4-8 / FGSC 9210) TaxID=578458 RepID=D8Q0Y8_SCHCM